MCWAFNPKFMCWWYLEARPLGDDSDWMRSWGWGPMIALVALQEEEEGPGPACLLCSPCDALHWVMTQLKGPSQMQASCSWTSQPPEPWTGLTAGLYKLPDRSQALTENRLWYKALLFPTHFKILQSILVHFQLPNRQKKIQKGIIHSPNTHNSKMRSGQSAHLKPHRGTRTPST